MLDNPVEEPTTAAESTGTEAPAPVTGEAPPAPKKRAPAKKAAAKRTSKKAAAKPAAEAPADASIDTTAEGLFDDGSAPVETPAKKTAARKSAAKKATAKRATTKKAAAAPPVDEPLEAPAAEADAPAAQSVTAMPLFKAPEPTAAPARRRRTAAAPVSDEIAVVPGAESDAESDAPAAPARRAAKRTSRKPASVEADSADTTPEMSDKSPGKNTDTSTDTDTSTTGATTGDNDQAPAGDDRTGGNRRGNNRRGGNRGGRAPVDSVPAEDEDESVDTAARTEDDSDEDEGGSGRRRRRRGGRRRRKAGDSNEGNDDSGDDSGDGTESDSASGGGADERDDSGDGGSSRRRRRRRRTGDDGGDGNGDGAADPQNTVTRVRKPRSAEDEITAVTGSTRLEAKKQRRREGREAGRRRAPIVSEAEFLARREAVDRVMVVRQRDDLTQIAVLEDKVLVEHYVARESQTSLIGNVYLGRVQNVLPSMEAAFIDIGKGRNAVLYAGEVNWSALGQRDGQARKIESVLSSGQPILVQVTKDPLGHKGARLTSQISLAGRFLVYVPDGTTSGISRKLPDTERSRLKALLKEIVPESAGVIVRTAAEGATEEELTSDVARLKARWEDIESKVKGSAPQLLYGEPDLTLKVVRDLFTEDFTKLVIDGQDAWDTVQGYVSEVAPDLENRLERYDRAEHGADIFATYRVDEQIAKGLDRKVWLPSGGSLVIDRTEAMTVVDVNTGKFTGSGGNLEETVTKNNLEAAEEMVRQLRLRDIGGIIVIDFIDMVLESNRDLVLRRLVECLGRDRTRHQVAEVTSLGLVQMTRKRIGTGLVESFSENCPTCQGRGVVIHDAPVEPRNTDDDGRRGGGRRTGRARNETSDSGNQSGNQSGRGAGGGRGRSGGGQADQSAGSIPSPAAVAAVARPENADRPPLDEVEVATAPPAQVEAASQPASESAAEPGVDSGAESGAPRVVTRSRRRAASRPAAAPSAQTETPDDAQPVPESTPTPEVSEPAAESGAESGAPRVVTRSRRRAASRPAAAPSAQTETPDDAQPVPESTPTPEVSEDVSESASESASESGAPKVVSRTRRAARRPAGPSTSSSASQPVSPVAAAPVVVAAPDQVAATVAEPPKVVTRTRGRSASRAAGPADGSEQGQDQSGQDVPVKSGAPQG